jgi:hypothetical protein
MAKTRVQVSRRCGCVDVDTGRQRGVTCPRLPVDDDHGSWYFAVQVHRLDGQLQRVRQGGYADPEEAQAAVRLPKIQSMPVKPLVSTHEGRRRAGLVGGHPGR